MNNSRAVEILNKEERTQGEWIEWIDERWGSTYLNCSLCKAEPLRDSHNKFVRSNFCPNCGAKMKGGADMRGEGV